MTRSLTITAVLLTVTVSVGLYHLAYAVQDLEDQLTEYNRAILRDRAAIQVLQAEWSYLTRPELLQERAARILDLQPLPSGQIVGLDELPERPPPAAERPLVIPIPKPRLEHRPVTSGGGALARAVPALPPSEQPIYASMKAAP